MRNRRKEQNRFTQVKPTKDMFLGGTVITRPNTNQVVACGHLWANEFATFANNKPGYQINPSGSCFAFDLLDESKQIGIFPMADQSKNI